MRNYTAELDALADEIALGTAYMLRLLERHMDTSGVARQVADATYRACALVISFTYDSHSGVYPPLFLEDDAA